MKYNVFLKIQTAEGEVKDFDTFVEFSKDEDTYGNGYYMKADTKLFGFMNVFDCRYDKRLRSNKLDEYVKEFFADRFSGENGSAKVISCEVTTTGIKELRTSAGMTQQEFADYFHFSKRAVESWEGGQRQCPDYLIELIEYKLDKEGLLKERD